MRGTFVPCARDRCKFFTLLPGIAKMCSLSIAVAARVRSFDHRYVRRVVVYVSRAISRNDREQFRVTAQKARLKCGMM